jgi:hypothetical protein
VLKNQTDILAGKLAYARILEKEAFVVEYESGGKRVGKGQKRQQGKRSGRKNTPPCIKLKSAGLSRWRRDAFLLGFHSHFRLR